MAVKVTELAPPTARWDGRYVDPFAAVDWKYAAGKKYGRIAYLYGHPSVSAKKTVDFFVAELEKLGLGDYDAIAIDLEETDGLPPAKVAARAAEVAALLEKRLGRVSLPYTYPNFALAGNCTGLGHLPLWISDRTTQPGIPPSPARGCGGPSTSTRHRV